MARQMKDSGVEWIGEIPDDWEIRPLKQILKERKEKNDPIKTSEILSLSMERGVFPYSEKVGGGNKAKEDLTAYKLAYPNDIVLNSMNVIVGAVGLSKYFGCVSPVYYTLYSRAENYDIGYYSNIFQSSIFQRSLVGYGNGIMMKESDNGKLNTIRMRIPMEKLNTLLLPVPSFKEEQQKIADFLDEKVRDIDSVITKTKETIDDYKKYKQAIITDAVTKGLNPNTEMKESSIEWVGEIPKQWKVTKVKVVSEKVTDGAHVSPETDNGIYDFISTVNLGKHGIEFENCLKTSEASYQQLVKNGCKPKINDVLISKDGTVGKTVVIDFDREFVVASSLVIIRPNLKLINPYYLGYNLQAKFVQEQLVMLMHGAGLKRVSVEKNANLPVVLPTLKEQKEIVAYLDEKCSEIDKLIAKKEELLADLESYKKSLIYEYVTGKKEVE